MEQAASLHTICAASLASCVCVGISSQLCKSRRRLRAREARDQVLRNRLGLELARLLRIAADPHPGLEALDRQARAVENSMLHIEARAAKLADARFSDHIVAVLRRRQELGARLHDRIAAELVGLQHLVFRHPGRTLEQARDAGFEHFEIARIEHDPGGVAVAPFDADIAAVGQHAFKPHRGAMRNPPSRRMTSPLRYVLRTQWSTRSANCSGRPSSCGNGTEAARLACTSLGKVRSIGVAKIPGAIAITRMPNWASSRAAGTVRAATPPFDAE